jgi:hypothetical protein
MLLGVTVDVRLHAFGVRYPQSTREQWLALGLEVPIYVRSVYVRTYVRMYVCMHACMYACSFVCI